jgi:hypothetical protein
MFIDFPDIVVVVANISDLGGVDTEENFYYLVDNGLRELKVFPQIIANVRFPMLGFLDYAISNPYCDLRRVEALEHKIEEGSSQRSPPMLEPSSRITRRIRSEDPVSPLIVDCAIECG